MIERYSWYDADWRACPRCRGTGEHVECYDDLCHAQNHCRHGNNQCALCEGVGRVTSDLADRWVSRDAFESVTLPDPDLHVRGRLHAVARARHDREVTRDV